mgnify:CR=1 FL=1
MRAAAVRKAGLILHAEYTKVLSNVVNERRIGPSSIMVGSQDVKVLGKECSTAYLGWELCLDDLCGVEVQHRPNKGWAIHLSLKKDLCNLRPPIQLRCRLFGSVVAPIVLYGSVAWTMNAASAK